MAETPFGRLWGEVQRLRHQVAEQDKQLKELDEPYAPRVEHPSARYWTEDGGYLHATGDLWEVPQADGSVLVCGPGQSKVKLDNG